MPIDAKALGFALDKEFIVDTVCQNGQPKAPWQIRNEWYETLILLLQYTGLWVGKYDCNRPLESFSRKESLLPTTRAVFPKMFNYSKDTIEGCTSLENRHLWYLKKKRKPLIVFLKGDMFLRWEDVMGDDLEEDDDDRGNRL